MTIPAGARCGRRAPDRPQRQTRPVRKAMRKVLPCEGHAPPREVRARWPGRASPSPGRPHAWWATPVGARSASLPGWACGPCQVSRCGRVSAVSGGGGWAVVEAVCRARLPSPRAPRVAAVVGCHRRGGCHAVRWSRRLWRGAGVGLGRGGAAVPQEVGGVAQSGPVRSGRAGGGRVKSKRSAVPSRPLTTHWSRRQQPPVRRGSSCSIPIADGKDSEDILGSAAYLNPKGRGDTSLPTKPGTERRR